MDGLNNPVSRPWGGLAVRLTRRPGQWVSITRQWGVSLDASTRNSPHRDIDVNIVEFVIEGGLHVGRTGEARCGIVRPSHPPQFLTFGKGHLPLVVAASDGAFDRHPSGHFPNITTTVRGRESDMRAGSSASTFVLVALWGQSLHPGNAGHKPAHRKGPLNAENAVRTTGLPLSRRNPRERTGLIVNCVHPRLRLPSSYPLHLTCGGAG